MTNRQKIFIDTSAWIALSSKGDQNHDKIKKCFSTIASDGALLFTSNDVIDETVTRFVYDVGWHQSQKFIQSFNIQLEENTLVQLWVDEKIQQDAFEILAKFDDQKLSLTDATTVAIMQRFKLDAVLTLDSDFKKIGVKSLP